MTFTVVIPARYASSRFPGKPLADIAGKPMVVRVAERAARSGAREVLVATDHAGIAATVQRHGYAAMLTRRSHASGTDRIAEVAARRGFPARHIVVNVQGDEPLIAPGLIRSVGTLLAKKPAASVSTACHAIGDPGALDNPNVVKVVLDAEGYALYFSRARIPYPRVPGAPCYRHAGIYGYRVAFLRQYARLKPAPLERSEALEQLRVLWHGYRIAVAVTHGEIAPGVDTPRDLEAVRKIVQ